MIKIDVNKSLNDFKPSFKENIGFYKFFLLNGFPYIIGATLLKIASESLFKLPTQQIINITSQVLDKSVSLIIVFGAYKFWNALEEEYRSLDKKRVEYIQIPKEEYTRLNEEIKKYQEKFIIYSPNIPKV